VELAKNPNIKGIKSGDIVLGRQVHLTCPKFEFLFSNLDIFDVGLTFGLPAVLDGMFTCTPVNAKLFAEAIKQENWQEAGKYLDRIVGLRNALLPSGVWPAYTVCMNLIGLEGNYGFGYEAPCSEAEIEQIKAAMKEIGEL
jgi:dihydrodipicolinate synthase/N-acetylneuraminate lyase